jgi:serine/arginine repetitive matrix protein 2
MSRDLRIGPTGNRMMWRPTTPVARGNISNDPLYYDYSEQFESDELIGYVEPMSNSLLKQVRTLDDQRDCVISPPQARQVPNGINPAEIERSERSELPGIAELEASPVGRRITKELIREGLEPMSTISDTVPFTSSPVQGDVGKIDRSHDQVVSGTVCDQMDASSMLPGATENRHSILSQTGSSVLNSSTLDFAIRYSIPAMTSNDIAHDLGSVSVSPDSPEKSTEDGMSELLAGYQHTDSKQEGDIAPGLGSAAFTESERQSNHAQKSSEAQSFKTCTDVPAPISPDLCKKEDKESTKSAKDVSPKSQLPVKHLDARYFETLDDATIPGHIKAMPPSPLTSSTLANVEACSERPVSNVPVSTSPHKKGRNIFARHASSFSLAPSKLRGSSKRSIKQGSMSVSASASSLNVTQQPPNVPPRESSTSKEAQRLNAVGSFLLRHVVPTRFSKEKILPSNTDVALRASVDNAASQPAQQDEASIGLVSVPQQRGEYSKTPEKAITKQDAVPGDQVLSEPIKEQTPSDWVGNYTPTKSLHVGITMVPINHRLSFSNLMSDIPGLDSALFPQEMSLKHGVSYSPAGAPKSPEYNHRDSQTTTHLSWGGRKPFSNSSTSASEPYLPLPRLQEDTTTDLRLSRYRYNGPQSYLPDLKEESHEDSSLNTSASNLKQSHFRFPYGGGPGLRSSVDDVILFSRRSSTWSHQRSAVGEAHSLPRIEFSQANLLDKLKDALGDIRFSRSSDLPVEDKGSQQGCMNLEELNESVKGENRVGGVALKTQRTAVIDFARLKSAYSPQKLKAEIDQLTIPSVTQLTQRFTELLPSLSLGDYHRQTENSELVEFPEEEEIMEHAIEEIHHVHPPSQKRSSARLRPIRGSSALMVIDDDVFENITSSEAASEVRAGRCWVEVEAGEARTCGPGKGKNTTSATIHPPARQLSPVAELQVPSPITLPPHTKTVNNQALRRSVDSAWSSTKSPSSFVSSPSVTDTRPWNFDKNYPWATTTRISVDIALPHPAALRQSPNPGPSHLRNTLSGVTTDSFTSTRTPTNSPTGNPSSPGANGQPHRLSIFGRAGDQVHAVGERYPTSALSPPTAIFRDHLSTCDTSDDEDFTTSRKSKLTLRKRFSSAARNNTLTNTTPRIARSKVNPAELASPVLVLKSSSSTLQDRVGEARAFTSNRHTFRDAEGMRSSAYHRHRIVVSIKRWWHKGGNLIRTISRRGNQQDVSDPASH